MQGMGNEYEDVNFIARDHEDSIRRVAAALRPFTHLYSRKHIETELRRFSRTGTMLLRKRRAPAVLPTS